MSKEAERGVPIFLLDIFGSPNIGVFMRATEEFLIIPNQIPETKVRKLEDWLESKIVKTNIGGSVLIGPLICANSNGLIVPKYTWSKEIDSLRSLGDVNITITSTKTTSYGNLVSANDYGAVVDPRLKKEDLKILSDTLGVEVVQGEIAGLPYVGSLTVATNRGILAHPLIKPEEESLLKDALKVPVGVGTINCGVPYISTGLIGNSKAAVAGFDTTEPELFIAAQALGMAD